jgi:hypothetical protein
LQRSPPSSAPADGPAPVQPAGAAGPDGGPASDGARYYSVHRQAGRQPDATPIPDPSYLDALPVELDQPPASTDLAEPPAAPPLIRDSSGRLRAAPPVDDPMIP